MNENESNEVPKEYGGFHTREAQIANTAFRGMKSDATVDEVNAYDQLGRDRVNAEHFGYPVGTPSREIGLDIAAGHGGVPESE